MLIQTPSKLKNNGKTIINNTIKPNVRKKDINAEINPLFKAVKKEEA